MSAGFTHLHVHSQYSLLDGAIRIPDLIEKCRELDMDSVAVTDHGAMYGSLEFYVKAKKAGIKPIIGCEFYIAPESRKHKKPVDGERAFHLVLLAMNEQGYKNLMKLASLAQSEGFYYKPRIDMELLRENNQGIIALSACLHGQIPWLILKNDLAGAKEKALEFKEIFGDRFYLELQENGIDDQQPVNEALKKLGKELDIKPVATNDCHYLTRDEAYAHEILLCIQMNRTINDPKRFRFASDEFYLKSAGEMQKAFQHCPEAIASTREIADRCNLELDLSNYYFPEFPVPDGESLESMFITACKDGLQERFDEMRAAGTFNAEVEKNYTERLEMEIKVINTMGFPGYFLIVADFINWAKDHDIPVGPGRGSGAGSLAAFCMRITNIDPIPYGLIFERFLNIERNSMPDFDVDFCMDRRGEVIEYVRKKYGGAEHVAQIITYGSMKAKGVIRDVGRALDIPLSEVNYLAKLVPESPKMTIDQAMMDEPKIAEAAAKDPRIDELLKISKTLEGLARHTSTHAAGVVISPKPMYEYLPTCRGATDEETTTQYDMKHTEMTGLIKFDFLGLKTLTVIDKAVKHIRYDRKTELNIDTIPMDDPKTYELLRAGDALGIFQLESSGMRELLVKMAPEQFSDLIALVALYRPGPLDSGMVDDFVETKHGRQQPNYPLPQIKFILEETYGVIVYQEQVMKIANVLANYSLGDADNLRRAMGKKIPEVMDKEKVKFMAGAKENKIDEKKAEYIFDLMAKFAGYGFNKSHSAAYALVSYQTAFLKAHYPAQFMASLLSCDMNNTDKVVLYINECKEHGIEVLPPDINQSMKDFSVMDDKIRFGLAAVKNVGEAALDSIIEEREQNGKFTSLPDFCNRVDARRVNSRVMESLIRSGSFDSLGLHRSQLMEILPQAIEQAKSVQLDRQSGQLSLFSVAPEVNKDGGDAADIVPPDIPEWDEMEKLAAEKETVGFYITGHPLDGVMKQIKSIATGDIMGLKELGSEQPVRVGGLIRSCKHHKSKKGDPMAFITVEDMFEAVEVVVFPDAFQNCYQVLNSQEPVIIQGKLQQEERGPKILADHICLLPEAVEKYTESIKVKLNADKTGVQKLEALKKIFYSYHGTCPVLLTLDFPERGEVDVEILKDLKVKPGADLTGAIDQLLGYSGITVFKKDCRLEARKKKWPGASQKTSRAMPH